MRTAFSRISGMTAQQRTSLADEFDRVSRIAVAEPVAVVGIGCRFSGRCGWTREFLGLSGRGQECDLDGAGRSMGRRSVLPPRPANTGADDDEVGRLRP